MWEIAEDGKTLIQPLAGIKGLGDSAIDQIVANRPFNSIEEFLFNENITYSKLNKKALDVLVRSKALDELMDDRFTGLKHFWSAVAVDRPRKEKNLLENIDVYAPEGDFSEEEKLEHFASLTGIFPIHEIMPQEIQDNLMTRGCPPISEYDPPTACLVHSEGSKNKEDKERQRILDHPYHRQQCPRCSHPLLGCKRR